MPNLFRASHLQSFSSRGFPKQVRDDIYFILIFTAPPLRGGAGRGYLNFKVTIVKMASRMQMIQKRVTIFAS